MAEKKILVAINPWSLSGLRVKASTFNPRKYKAVPVVH